MTSYDWREYDVEGIFKLTLVLTLKRCRTILGIPEQASWVEGSGNEVPTNDANVSTSSPLR